MGTPVNFKADRNCFFASALTVTTGFRLALDWVVNHFFRFPFSQIAIDKKHLAAYCGIRQWSVYLHTYKSLNAFKKRGNFTFGQFWPQDSKTL